MSARTPESRPPPSDRRELARRFLEALSACDGEAAGELVHPQVEIRTDRTIHRGRSAVVAWAAKTFEHLERRYLPVSFEERDDGIVVHADLEYVWRETGKVGDRARVAIELGIRDGRIGSWRLREEPVAEG